MTTIIFKDDGQTDIAPQMRMHEDRLRLRLTDAQIKALAYVEGALLYSAPAAALAEYEQLPAETKATPEALALQQQITQACDDAQWWPCVHAAMRAAVGGATKMSHSGKKVIFGTPQCGRSDLSSWREVAERQLAAAGIVINTPG